MVDRFYKSVTTEIGILVAWHRVVRRPMNDGDLWDNCYQIENGNGITKS